MGHVTLFRVMTRYVVEGLGKNWFLSENSDSRTWGHRDYLSYAFQKRVIKVEHVLRDNRRNNAPKELLVDLLDGRYHSKGENKHDTYEGSCGELIRNMILFFSSVRHGFVKEAVGRPCEK